MPLDGRYHERSEENPSWWGRMVMTSDGRIGRSESNPDPEGPYFLVFVRFEDGEGEWFRQSTLRLF